MTFSGALADGAYRSPDLPVVYTLVRDGDTLKLTVSPADNSGQILSAFTLKPTGEGYAGPGFKLLPDADGAGFAMQGGRLTLNFRKAG